MKPRAPVAWVIASVALTMIAFYVALVFLNHATRVPGVVPELVPTVAFGLGGALIGALIASRRRGGALGWIFLGIAIVLAQQVVSEQYAFRGLVVAPHSLPGSLDVGWAQAWDNYLFNPLPLALMFLYFPTGTLPTRRWRPIVWVIAIGSLMAAAFTAVRPGLLRLQCCGISLHASNPFGVRGLGGPAATVQNIDLGAVAVVFPAVIGSLVVRWRRAPVLERQQIKWLLFVAALVALGAVGYVLAGVTNGLQSPLANAVGNYATVPVLALGVPIASGIAIFRYRLYDIDRIISRTLSYALITALLGGLFALVVLLPTAVIGSGRTPGWLVAAATLVAFGLFRPLRRRVQDAVDHRFNRRRYDVLRTVESFGTRLRDELDLQTLRHELTSVISETMQPAHVSLWIRPEESAR